MNIALEQIRTASAHAHFAGAPKRLGFARSAVLDSRAMDETVAGRLRVPLIGGTLEDSETGLHIAIEDEPRVVGRGPSSDLRLKDKQVSSAHCALSATDQGVMVRDLGSTNGTAVGGLWLGPNQFGFVQSPTTLRVGATTLSLTPGPAASRALPKTFGLLQSQSTAMQRVFARLRKLADTTVSLHITGESGTGKEFIAKAVHDVSRRASRPFVVVDCTTIPANLAEAELFGHVAGAFTGAMRAKESPFKEADGGTVFLDEIGDLPLDVQAKLLRVVDKGEFKRVGENKYQKVDVRIISATLHDLGARLNAGHFREDLYSRLTAVRVALPPLRDRLEDFEAIMKQIFTDRGRPDAVGAVSEATVDWLKTLTWAKGNIRQLKQILDMALDLWRDGPLDIEEAYALSGDNGQATLRAVSEAEAGFKAITAKGTSHKAVRREADRILFEHLIRDTRGNQSEIARRTDVSRLQVRRVLNQLGLRVADVLRRG